MISVRDLTYPNAIENQKPNPGTNCNQTQDVMKNQI